MLGTAVSPVGVDAASAAAGSQEDAGDGVPRTVAWSPCTSAAGVVLARAGKAWGGRGREDAEAGCAWAPTMAAKLVAEHEADDRGLREAGG